MHLVDWLPTLATIGGATSGDLPRGLNGIDFSAVLKSTHNTNQSPRQRMLYGVVEKLDQTSRHYQVLRSGAYIEGNWKVIMQSNIGDRNDWYVHKCVTTLPPSAGNRSGHLGWHHFPAWRQYWALYDLSRDLYEEDNVLYDHLSLFCRLRQRLHTYMTRAARPLRDVHGLQSAEADPARHGGFWTYGYC